jgi:hypothetical protein
MTAQHFAALLVLTGALSPTLACGEGSPSLDDLAVPLVFWRHSVGLCSRLRVVDGQRALWGNDGCEGTSLEYRRHGSALGQTGYHALMRSVDALPGSSESAAACKTPSQHGFMFEQTKGLRKYWTVCGGPVVGLDDLSALDGPFLSIALQLRTYFIRNFLSRPSPCPSPCPSLRDA